MLAVLCGLSPMESWNLASSEFWPALAVVLYDFSILASEEAAITVTPQCGEWSPFCSVFVLVALIPLLDWGVCYHHRFFFWKEAFGFTFKAQSFNHSLFSPPLFSQEGTDYLGGAIKVVILEKGLTLLFSHIVAEQEFRLKMGSREMLNGFELVRSYIIRIHCSHIQSLHYFSSFKSLTLKWMELSFLKQNI